jgi:hypothetical protein
MRRVPLSVCLITADPASRLEAILEPLRPFAQEIVIAADSRVDGATLGGYRALADRLFKIEFAQSERHLAWLYAQCSGDWILKLDGDEVPSQAFVRRLPRLLASRSAQQFWTPNAWLFPDREHSLGDAPWSDDFTCRLMRNDGTLRVRGIQHLHADPVAPREYLEEPFYHLDLLITDLQRRRDKTVRYEVMRPHMLAAGGGRINEAFYLPELRDSLELRAVDEEDRATIARALSPAVAADKDVSSTADVPFVSLAKMDRVWEGRAVSDGAYRARVEPREPESPMTPSEQRQLFFAVVNEGDERWPASLDAHPQIRLAYRWLNPDGSPHAEDSPRSAFSRVVDPGERILMPLDVNAPTECGDYLLEVDIVHEHVRWFGCACRVPVRVGYPAGLSASGIRLGSSTPTRRPRWRRLRIPRTLHRVWVGAAPMPAEYEHFGETFGRHHPGWEMRTWTDGDLPGLDIDVALRERARTPSELSNLMRYEVLRRYGGVYVDTDVECLRPLTPLLRGVDAFAALECPGRVGNAVLGAVPSHPVFERAARLARGTLGIGAHSADANGPYFLSLLLEQASDVTIFPAELFYPFRWDETERRHELFPDAYAVHHWATGSR